MAISPAAIERSDVCAVPAAAVVGEAMVALVLADALTEKFGGDAVEELVENWRAFTRRTGRRFAAPRS
jgi:chorismate synthase